MAELIIDKLTPVRLSEQVANHIEALILESLLHPGDKLPSERELSTAFDVTRPVVRESVKFLAMTRPLIEMILKLGHVAFSHGRVQERHQHHKRLLDSMGYEDV